MPWRAGSVVEYRAGDTVLGRVGELAPAVRRALDVEPPVLLAEFDFEALLEACESTPGWEPFSAYPPVRRDLSLVVPRQVSWTSVRERVEAAAEDLLENPEAPYRLETVGFGVANGLLAQGDTERATAILERLYDDPWWPGFGRIAAEVELFRLGWTPSEG